LCRDGATFATGCHPGGVGGTPLIDNRRDGGPVFEVVALAIVSVSPFPGRENHVFPGAKTALPWSEVRSPGREIRGFPDAISHYEQPLVVPQLGQA